MKKILLILVGGTICSSLNEDGNLSVSREAGILLKQNFLNSDSLYVDAVDIESTENLYVLSENMTVDKWNTIIDTYRKHVAGKVYDGIIMAHGTDTLAYSAALFSLLLSAAGIPVFLVSANENLKSDRTNGNVNFRCAVECIARGIKPNVYVPYKNLSDGKLYLHLASRLRQCENYSEDFHSVGELDISGLSEENYPMYFEQLEKQFPYQKQKRAVDIFGNWKLKNCILYLNPYVGMNYSAYAYDKFEAVLHGAFHSGTACAEKNERCSEYGENSILYMLDKCFQAEKKTEVYFSPSVLKSGTYETVSMIGNHTVNGKRISFMYGCTYEMAYAKLVIAYSVLETEEERKRFIENEYNFELIETQS